MAIRVLRSKLLNILWSETSDVRAQWPFHNKIFGVFNLFNSQAT